MPSKRGSRAGLRKVRWGFDEGPDFPGYTDDTTWNGWLNVWVSPTTHKKVIAWLRSAGRMETEEDQAMADLTPGDDGLISYAYGYTTQEVE
jgi:hypothetical protein